MMKRELHFLLVYLLLFGSCRSPGGELENEEARTYYQQQMRAKGYGFESWVDCDKDLEQSEFVMARGEARVDSIVYLEGVTRFYVAFLDDCCQEFMGDYHLYQDSLVFKYEPIGDELCECKCLYHYRLDLAKEIPEELSLTFRAR